MVGLGSPTYLFRELDGIGTDCASSTPDKYLFFGSAAARFPHAKKDVESGDGSL